MKRYEIKRREKTLYVFRDQDNEIVFETINPLFFVLETKESVGVFLQIENEEDAMFVGIPDLSTGKLSLYQLDSCEISIPNIDKVHMDKEYIVEDIEIEES